MFEGLARTTARFLALAAAAFAVKCSVLVPWQTNRTLYKVGQRTQNAQAMDPSSARRTARANLLLLNSVDDPYPFNVDFHMLSAANERELGEWSQALKHYNLALNWEHLPELYYERGLTELEVGENAAAVNDLVIATRFQPAYMDGFDYSLRSLIFQRARECCWDLADRPMR